MEVASMETRCGCLVRVEEESQVGDARRQFARLATELGFDETDAGRVALVTTEMAGNLVKHTPGGGRLLAQPRLQEGVLGMDVLALDRGPGIPNVAAALRDGFTTAGSPGTGLGAISRVADGFDIQSTAELGTAILARFWPKRAEPAPIPVQVGAVHLSQPRESVCGDNWAILRRPGGALILVADGLGHGPGAAEASNEAVRVFRGLGDAGPVRVLEEVHAALRSTRGAAVSVAALDAERGEVRFAGVGNVAGSIAGGEREQSMVSHNGTAGHQVGRLQEFVYPWPAEAMVVMHSDGVQARWTFSRYPGLAGRDPVIVAGIIYRDFGRDTDDATVVVARRAT
jgi:anti-sigma regulatory factor (Ser/Thr protein kinase)